MTTTTEERMVTAARLRELAQEVEKLPFEPAGPARYDVPETVPEVSDIAGFNMHHYLNRLECGTVCCLAGLAACHWLPGHSETESYYEVKAFLGLTMVEAGAVFAPSRPWMETPMRWTDIGTEEAALACERLASHIEATETGAVSRSLSYDEPGLTAHLWR